MHKSLEIRLKSSCCKQQKAGQGPENEVNLALLSLNIPHIYHASLLLTLVSQPHPLLGGEVPHCGDCRGDRQRQDHPGQRRRRQSLALCCESPPPQFLTYRHIHNIFTRGSHQYITLVTEAVTNISPWLPRQSLIYHLGYQGSHQYITLVTETVTSISPWLLRQSPAYHLGY